jgi:hypothetical protein
MLLRASRANARRPCRAGGSGEGSRHVTGGRGIKRLLLADANGDVKPAVGGGNRECLPGRAVETVCRQSGAVQAEQSRRLAGRRHRNADRFRLGGHGVRH